MAFTKKHLDAQKNCYLIKPEGDRCRGFNCLRYGEVTDVEPGEGTGLAAIYFRRTVKDDLLSLVHEVEIELRKNYVTGASSDLAEAVIILSIAYRQTQQFVSLDKILSDYADVETTTFVGIPTMAVYASDPVNLLAGVQVGRFSIGGIANVEHKRRFKKRTMTREVKGQDGLPQACAWIMREALTCRVISAAFDESLARDIRERYLGHLTSDLSKGFKADFEADQCIPAALGASAIDSDAFFEIEHLQLAIDFGTLGTSEHLVVPFGVGRSIPADLRKIGEKNTVLKRFISDKPFGSCPAIDRLLKTYSRFLLRAKSHETNGRASEAFIHCIFALDLALGGKQDTTKNITRRAAAIYSGASGTPFKSAEKELREFFDARSKYVHEGVEVPEQKFALLLQVCGVVTECLLRSRHATYSNHERFITDYWYPRLDLVVAAMNAGADLGDALFYSECGVKQPEKVVVSVIH